MASGGGGRPRSRRRPRSAGASDQRAPAAVSSMTSPAAASWSRMASAVAQSCGPGPPRAARAAPRRGCRRAVHVVGRAARARVPSAGRAGRGRGRRAWPTSASAATRASLSSAASAVLPAGRWCGRRRAPGDAQVVVHRLGEPAGSARAGRARRGAGQLAADALRRKPSIRANAGLGLAQRLLAVLDHRAVVRGAEVVAQHDRARVLTISETSTELPSDLHIFSPLMVTQALCTQYRAKLVAEGLGLGDLVLVVREDQVEAAAVDVEGVAEVLVGHRRALQVPAGPAAAPGRLPARRLGSPGLAPFHRAKSRGSRLPVSPSPERLARCRRSLVGQRAVPGEGADVEVDVAVGLVGVAAFDEAAHHLDHLGDVAGGARLVGGRQAAEGVVAVVEGALVLVADDHQGGPARPTSR